MNPNELDDYVSLDWLRKNKDNIRVLGMYLTRIDVLDSVSAKLTFNDNISIVVRVFFNPDTGPEVSKIEIMEQLRRYNAPSEALRKLQGGVRLWRAWRYLDDQLFPLIATEPWVLDETGSVRAHDLPRLNRHGAGFYGFFRLKELRDQAPEKIGRARTGAVYRSCRIVIGSFIGWGRVVKGEKGAKTEYAKPEYLILPDMNDDYALELMTLADKYKMKPITAAQAKTLKSGLIPWHITQ